VLRFPFILFCLADPFCFLTSVLQNGKVVTYGLIKMFEFLIRYFPKLTAFKFRIRKF